MIRLPAPVVLLFVLCACVSATTVAATTVAGKTTVGKIAIGKINAAKTVSGSCPPRHGVAVQVLGSGGPIADDARASSAYLVWVDGASRVLIDAGGGAFLRFGEAGAGFADLDFVGISHLHTDHSADFPALLKSGNFSNRVRPLTVAGPDERLPFPGFEDYLASLLAEGGAYAYLGGYLDGSAGLVELSSVEVAGDETHPTRVFGDRDSRLRVDAIHVPHGIVPALAFRIEVDGVRIVFASDQNGSDPRFVEFAKDVDLLVMHLVIPEDATGVARRLHAPPSVIGEIAQNAGAKRLLLSHLMARSLARLDESLALIDDRYAGTVLVADDLLCIHDITER